MALRDIDRLIEMGLSRYGAGDLDGAVLLWEEALAIEPDNAQASSYVDYVRLNYEVLTTGSGLAESPSADPYGIEEEPEYLIEATPGAAPLSADATPNLAAVDDGWFDDDSATGTAPSYSERPAAEPTPGASFEDATREYQGMKRADAPAELTAEPPPDDLDEGTGGPTQGFFRGDEATSYQPTDEAPDSGFEGDVDTGTFQHEGTPGFANLQTEIRKRDLGFVKPVVTMPPRARTGSEETGGVSIATAPTMNLLETPPSGNAPSQAEMMMSQAPTRELGLRAAAASAALPNPADDDMPTGQTDVRAIRRASQLQDGNARDAFAARRQVPQDPIAAIGAQILEAVDATAPAGESPDDRTRRRITQLLEKAAELEGEGQFERAVVAVDLVLSEDPDSAVAQKLVTRHRDAITSVFQNYIGDLERSPRLARSLNDLADAQINPRAAFLLSRIDGMITIDELLDVSGMPRLEAYRYICQLYLRDILR